MLVNKSAEELLHYYVLDVNSMILRLEVETTKMCKNLHTWLWMGSGQQSSGCQIHTVTQHIQNGNASKKTSITKQ